MGLQPLLLSPEAAYMRQRSLARVPLGGLVFRVFAGCWTGRRLAGKAGARLRQLEQKAFIVGASEGCCTSFGIPVNGLRHQEAVGSWLIGASSWAVRVRKLQPLKK